MPKPTEHGKQLLVRTTDIKEFDSSEHGKQLLV
jgi:hypothetical protein